MATSSDENVTQHPRAKAPDFHEIATTLDGRDITRGYVWPQLLLLPQDNVLTTRGGNDLRAYEDLLRDTQVKSAFEQRRLAIVGAPLDVRPGGERPIDKQAADSMRAQLEAISFDRITDKILYGLFYGYSVGECLWGRDGREIVLEDIKVRKSRRFRFDGALRLRMLTYSDLMGELLPDRKFWIFSAGADNDDEPYGLGLGYYTWWPVFFKRHDIRFWLIFLEKFGQPTAHGKYPRQSTQEDQAKLLEAVQAIQTDSGVITPEGMPIDLIEAARSGTADYAAMHDVMDKAISKGIMGQTMTSDSGSSRSQAQVHMEVRQDLVEADIEILCDSFNAQVARWLTEWNYPGAAIPRITRSLKKSWRDLQASADLDQKLGAVGYRRTLEDVKSTYGGEWEDTGMPAQGQQGAPQPAFAEPGRSDTPGDQADRLGNELDPMVEQWIEQIRHLVDSSSSLEDVQSGLIHLYPHMTLDQYGQAMREALTAAELAGRSDIMEQAGGG
ncbi:MAG TPA: DUF935 family protein [Gammaproteobacteria bacterium]|nr:DUF935 family protein [Gammaproteobacteria bacterium]